MKDRSRGCTARSGVSPLRTAGIIALGLIAGQPIVDSAPSAAIAITVLEPGIADSVFALGDSITIRWIYPGGMGSAMELKISLDSGLTYRKSLFQDKYYMTSDTEEAHLTIPNDPLYLTTGAVVLVRDYNRVDNNGASPIFTIRNSSAVRQGPSRSLRVVSSGCAARTVYTANGRLVLSVANARATAPAVMRVGLPAGLFLRAAPVGTGGIRVLTTGTR